MATTTPNYGWAVPTSTDLVKDGATAIETLGDAIDASMNTALGTKKAGMVLLNTTSFSAVASHSLATNTFSSTYTNYRIVFDYIYGSANALLRLRYRKAGTDNTSSIYYSGVGFTNWSGVAGVSTSSAAATSSAILSLATTTGNLILDISQPLVRPLLTGMAMQAGPEDRGVYISAYINGSDTFDSLTLFPASGTITGSYSVYGLNKA
jgi:hypothetical protein